ncbi:MAG: hypothetical protein ACYDHU_09755 [Acidimicrobiales bacterium]
MLDDGTEIDAVLVAVAESVLTYEGWDRDTVQPNGEPHTVGITRIVGIPVF